MWRILSMGFNEHLHCEQYSRNEGYLLFVSLFFFIYLLSFLSWAQDDFTQVDSKFHIFFSRHEAHAAFLLVTEKASF
jgi:hypothetical protein